MGKKINKLLIKKRMIFIIYKNDIKHKLKFM